jgi:hypothetical protein
MKKTEIKVGDRIIEGEIIDFEIVKEDWSIYKLADGSTIRVKTVATRFIKTNEFTPDGEPTYQFQSMGPLMIADVPEELKKKTP